jgi:hypothetical protein
MVVTLGIRFIIVNTCRSVLDWCVCTIGHGIVVEAKNTPKTHRRLQTWRFALGEAHVLIELLPKLRPYLRIKGPQADAALQFLNGRRQRGGPFSEEDMEAAFNLRLANQKSYNKGAVEHVLYRKTPYTRDQFRELILEGRGSARYQVIEWTPEMDTHVGTDSDRRVAERLGLKMAQVQRRRTQLGRMPFGWVIPEVRTKIHQLRQKGMTLEQIATTTGVSPSSVQRVLSKPV